MLIPFCRFLCCFGPNLEMLWLNACQPSSDTPIRSIQSGKNRVSQENRHVMIAGANQCWRIGSGTLGGRHDHLAPPPAHRVNEFRYRSYFYFTWKASTEPG